MTLFIGKPPCGGFPWGTRQNWTLTIQAFCLKNNVPYNLFQKWFKDTRHKVVPIQVDGIPPVQEEQSTVESPTGTLERQDLKIMIDIRMTNGLHISRRGMSYSQLKALIANLEVL